MELTRGNLGRSPRSRGNLVSSSAAHSAQGSCDADADFVQECPDSHERIFFVRPYASAAFGLAWLIAGSNLALSLRSSSLEHHELRCLHANDASEFAVYRIVRPSSSSI